MPCAIARPWPIVPAALIALFIHGEPEDCDVFDASTAPAIGLFLDTQIKMDTIRTLYVSADQAVKAANNTYEYNIVGGISVAEGSRVYVDNIAMVNNVCDEVDDKNDQVYVSVFESTSVPDLQDENMIFIFDGGPRKNNMTTDDCVASEPFLSVALPVTTWTEGVDKFVI